MGITAKLLIISGIIFGLFFGKGDLLLAKKKLPLRKKIIDKNLPVTNLKLRVDKKALLLIFSNLQTAANIHYILTYESDGVNQGIEGSYDPALGSIQKELVLGTCSGNNCVYHQNITGMAFQVSVGLKDGRTLTRKYQIKI